MCPFSSATPEVIFSATVDEGGVKFNFMQNAKQSDLGTANDSEEWWYISFLPHTVTVKH